MKRAVVILLLLGFSANGQNLSFTEFDLYGSWVLSIDKVSLDTNKLIYIKQEQSETKLRKESELIYFQAFGECKIITHSSFYCGNESLPPDYSWDFEEENGIINIYSSIKLLKEIKVSHPKEYEKLELPEKIYKMKLKLVELADGAFGLEKVIKAQKNLVGE
jgi:hypothetical protein